MSDDSPAADDTAAPVPVVDRKTAALVLTKYHRFKGVLDDDHEASVSHFQLDEDTEAADTALSDIYTLKIAYQLPLEEHERNLNLIIKQLPQDPFARLFVKEAQFDLREIKFYTKIVLDMVEFLRHHLSDELAEKQLPIPKCYYPLGDGDDVDVSPETLLILEDLKAHDYRSPNFSTGLRLDQALLALEAIAEMHALSLAMRLSRRDAAAFVDLYPFLFQTDKATDAYQMLLDRGLPQLQLFMENRPRMGHVLDAILDIRDDMKHIICALLSPRCPIALLTHTDFWCNNLLFRGDNRHCIVLDWQMVTYSRPTNDVALLLISSLSAELRRQNRDRLLDAYWAAFTSFGAKLGIDAEGALGYTRAHLQADYCKSQLLAILLCIGSIEVALGDASAEQRLLDALDDLHAEQIFSPQNIADCLTAADK